MHGDDDIEALRRQARPDDLASLRRLDAALVRADSRVEGKTVREWIADFAPVHTRWFDGSGAVHNVCAFGLGAVPALVDTLRAKRASAWWKADQNIRTQCVEALGRIDPLPTCAIPALLGALRQPSARIRRMALAVLARMHPRPSATALRELLACLQDKHDADTRARAAHALAEVDGPLPDTVRHEALARLGDAVGSVRRFALQLCGRFPGDAEVLTALEEQSILDDANRLEALRVLSELEPSRAVPLLLEVAWRVVTDRREGRAWDARLDAHRVEQARREEGMRALLLLGRLGARAESALLELRRLAGSVDLEPYADSAIDDITRALLRRAAPPLPPERFQEPRVACLLRDVPPPSEPTEEPVMALARWASAFRAFGPEVTVRVALAAARRVVGLWEYEDPMNDTPRRAVRALEAWVCEPTEPHAQRVASQGNFIPSQVASSPDAFSAAWAVNYAAACVPLETPPKWPPSSLLDEEQGGFLGSCVYAACRALGRQSVITWSFGSSAHSPTPLTPLQAVRAVRQAILDEVLPWACGTWDPIQDVLARRQL